MDKKADFAKKYLKNNLKKKQNILKSINNYLSQLKMHFELSDEELYDILKMNYKEYKKRISPKRWWQIFD